MFNICSQNECNGCHACFCACPVNCIIMKNDVEGFLYPHIDQSSCIDCNLCQKVCPILKNTSSDNIPSAFSSYHKDDHVRKQSSSGGVFTAIAEHIISNNGVVFGACFDDNFKVVHGYAETFEELKKMRGSKYVQSEIGNTYREIEASLAQKRLVLFTGTPCQVAGLKSYLRDESEYLITQDIICHGVPSPAVWRKYLNQYNDNGDIQSISFRNKDNGWNRFSMKVITADKEVRRDLSQDVFLRAFLSDLCLRPSCYHCHFKGLNRGSDITLADFWGVEVLFPAMVDDKGVSLVLINSSVGQKLFNDVKNDLISKSVDVEAAVKYNKSATRSVTLPEKRQYFFDNLERIPFEDLVKQCTKEKISTQFKRIFYRIRHKVKKIFFT